MTQDTNKIAEQVGRVHVGELGSYRILESIGAGGMGSVALGEVLETSRRVALKFLHEELAEEGSSSRDRFEREIRVLQDLKAFRGIVQIEDWGRTEDGILFLVMEYVSAPTLDKIIEQNPQGLSQIRAVQIITEILSVLEPIHHRKFIHRDLKPHNICVYEEPLAIRLLDFGLSKPFTEGLGYDKVTKRMQGKGSEIPGSPHYMAVEQFLRPKEVDERTDMYAVGIILYELLAGIPPFRGIYLQDILKQHKETEPPPIDTCADGGPISYRLQAVVDKSLAKKPESRYQSAGEFKEALFDVLNMLNKQRRPRKTLDGRYRILRKIGQGGNSEVFEAEKLDDSTRAALKIAREGSSDWDEETLMNEADRALNHENIVRVHEFGEFEGRPALVMELLEGGTLEDILKQFEEDGLPENIFYRSMVDICRGLHHAHQSNIVHRDVKPGNMLRTVEGKTKVCDFGIAKRFEQSGDEIQGAKNTTLAKGTAQYISPEQCDMQGRVDRRADVYCLGVMMYEMLAGVLPFTEGILIMQHLQMDPPALKVKGRYRNPDALARIVERAMQKDPAKRFQSMKELAQELVRVSKLEPQEKAHKPVALHTIPEEWKDDPARGGLAATTKMETAGKKSLVTKIAVAAVIVVLAAVAIVAGMNGNDDPQPTPGNGGQANGNDGTRSTGPTLDDLAREEAKGLRALVDTGDWGGFKAAELDALMKPEGQRYRAQVLDEVEFAAASSVGEAPADAADIKSRLAELAAIAECAERVEKGSATASVLNAFVAKARVLENEPKPDENGWIGFDDAHYASAREAVEALKGGFEKRRDAWSLYIDNDERDRYAANAAAVAATLGEANDAAEAAIAHVRELESRSSGGTAPEAVLTALTGWTTRMLRAVEAVPARFDFDDNGIARAAGVSGDELLASVRRLRAGSRRNPANAADAVALGILAAENDDSVLDAVKVAISLDPPSWPEARSRVESLGIPVDSFQTVVSRAVERIFDDPGFSAAVMRGAPTEAAAMGAHADRMDGFLSSLLSFASLSSSARSQAEARWNSATASLRVGGEAIAREAVTKALSTWKGAKSWQLKDLVGLFSQMNRHAGQYQGDAADMRGEAAAILDQLGERGLFLTEVILVSRSGSLVPGAEAASRIDAAKKGLVAALTESPDENLGIVGACNADWAAKTDRCIVVKYLLPKSEGALFADGSVSVVTGSGDVRIDGGELMIEASPAELDVASRGTGGPLRIDFDLKLSSKQYELADEPLTITVQGPDRFDFEPPQVRPTFGSRPTADGWVVSVDVDDASPPSGGFAPKLTVNGREKAPRSRNGATSEWALGLGDLAKGTAVDAIRVIVTDAFENTVTLEADRNDIDDARRDLVGNERRNVSQSFRSSADALRGKPFAASAVRDTKAWIDRGRSRLGDLGEYDRPAAKRLAEDLLALNLAAVTGTWMTGDLTTATLEGAKSAVDELVAAVREVENDFGLGSAESSRLVSAYQQKISDSKRGATAGGGGSGGGESGRGGTRSRPLLEDDRPRRKEPFEDYEKGAPSINLAGLTLIKVDGGRDGPAWVSTVEVSKSFAEQHFPAAVRSAEAEARSRHKRLKWKLESQMPLVPLTPNHVEDALAAIRRSVSTGGLEAKCGGPVEWNIPSKKQWQAAGKVHAGGRSQNYAWGDDAGGSGNYGYRNSGDSRAGWYDGLRGVGSDPARGSFDFLSGNAWEIVRDKFQGTRYKRIGGSMLEACDGRTLKYLELKSSGQTQSPDASERFTGFRLALVPTKK